MKAVLLLLDESMSGWRPKTSKLGGLPNYTFEPRKPVPLGTMFRNGVDCMTGCLLYQDIVQLPEQQQRKNYHGVESHLPKGEPVSSHTAEVLRQVEGAGIPEGGWVGGDAWFGSVATAVEVFKRLRVHSTWVIKSNHTYYPMQVLYAILRARYGDYPVGHWVVMRTRIADVPLFACTYAWSQSRVAYFLSTCGKTVPSTVLYRSSFEDEYGNVKYKDINRPQFAHFLYEFLPLIDEHNKQRQAILRLEKSWPTRTCWFQLLTTIVGMCVVDFHNVWRNQRRKQYVATSALAIDVEEMEIKKFSDLICANLREVLSWRALTLQQFHDSVLGARGQGILERIQNESGSTTRNVTEKQKQKLFRSVGTSRQMNCFVCRKYLSPAGSTVYRSTSFWCKTCRMPLCKKDRSVEGSIRIYSCIEEHAHARPGNVMACDGSYTKATPFPTHLQVRMPREGGQVQTGRSPSNLRGSPEVSSVGSPLTV